MGNYVKVADVEAETNKSHPTGLIDRRIAKWEEIVEQVTRNIFRVISPGELTFYGNGMRTLYFNLPLVSVSSLKINDSETELATNQYRAFTGKMRPRDHRKNPRIQLVGRAGNSIFTGGYGGVFAKDAEQKITATWGFVDENNETPEAIKDAIISLVVRDLTNYETTWQSGAKPIAPLVRRAVDLNSQQFGDVQEVRTLWSMIPQDIADTLMLYRAPIAIR